MIRFEPKPEFHTRTSLLDCRRCQVAAREGALRVHVMKLSELLDTVRRVALDRRFTSRAALHKAAGK